MTIQRNLVAAFLFRQLMKWFLFRFSNFGKWPWNTFRWALFPAIPTC